MGRQGKQAGTESYRSAGEQRHRLEGIGACTQAGEMGQGAAGSGKAVWGFCFLFAADVGKTMTVLDRAMRRTRRTEAVQPRRRSRVAVEGSAGSAWLGPGWGRGATWRAPHRAAACGQRQRRMQVSVDYPGFRSAAAAATTSVGFGVVLRERAQAVGQLAGRTIEQRSPRGAGWA